MSMRNVGGDGKGWLGNGVQLPPIPTGWMGRLRPEKHRLCSRSHSQAQAPPADKKAFSLQGLDSLLSDSIPGRL